MQVQWQFNANQYAPQQGIGIHPPAQKIPFQIVNTEIVDTKDKTGSMLVVEFNSPMGTIINRYNIRNASPKATEIAYGQLSALCHATGIYNLDGNNECAALRGGRGLMDVGYQKDEEPNPQFPDRKGYTELKKVYDMAGNEPGKTGGQQQQAQQMQQPTQQQPQGGPTPLQQQPGGGWGQPNPAPQQAPQQQPQGQQGGFQQPQQNAPQGQAWQPGGGQPQTAPPWGNR